MSYNYIFFDLDGTLTDPEHGLLDSFAYGLGKMGIFKKRTLIITLTLSVRPTVTCIGMIKIKKKKRKTPSAIQSPVIRLHRPRAPKEAVPKYPKDRIHAETLPLCRKDGVFPERPYGPFP